MSKYNRKLADKGSTDNITCGAANVSIAFKLTEMLLHVVPVNMQVLPGAAMSLCYGTAGCLFPCFSATTGQIEGIKVAAAVLTLGAS